MYVCMYVMYVCITNITSYNKRNIMYVCMYTCMHHVCMYVCMYVYDMNEICMYVCICM